MKIFAEVSHIPYLLSVFASVLYHCSYFKHRYNDKSRAAVFEASTALTFHTKRPDINLMGERQNGCVDVLTNRSMLQDTPLFDLCWICLFVYLFSGPHDSLLCAHFCLFFLLCTSPKEHGWRSWGCFWKMRRGSCVQSSLTLISPSSM